MIESIGHLIAEAVVWSISESTFPLPLSSSQSFEGNKIMYCTVLTVDLFITTDDPSLIIDLTSRGFNLNVQN